MISALATVRPMLRLVMLMAFSAMLPAQSVFGAGSSLLEACRRWPQNRLIVDGGLQSRRFTLEARGESEEAPILEAGARKMFHRTFILSLDIAEPIALFHTRAQNTCIVARDKEKSVPLKIPVFFVGRAGQSGDDLKAGADRVAFTPSKPLGDSEDFAEVRFYLRTGGSYFGDIRPFFACGLPCIMLCEDTCPGDTLTLARSLVDWVVKAPVAGSSTAEAKPDPLNRPAAPATVPLACPGAGAGTPPKLEASPLPPQGPRVAQPKPAVTAETPEPARPEEPRVAEPSAQPKPAATAETPEPAREHTPNPGGAPHPTRRLVIAFERKPGTTVDAAEVLRVEHGAAFEGAPLAVAEDNLAVELPEEAFARANTREGLQQLFPHYRIVAVKLEPSRTLLTVEPLFVAASDLTISVVNGAGEPAKGCDLALDVPPDRQLGGGWQQVAAAGRMRGLRFHELGAGYVLDPPPGVEKNELLIGTAGTGGAARLTNAAPECDLEARPSVTAEELRTGLILRSLQETGPIFVALLSTDSSFSAWLDTASVEAFWSGALDLAASVSVGPWEKKLLARVQAPGPSQNTGILKGTRSDILKKLIEGSRSNPWPRAMTGSKPIQRFELDLALEPIRHDAGIVTRDSALQESLLLITGSIDPGGGGYFCRHPVRQDRAPWARPHWTSQARRAFVLEVWSAAAAEAMRANKLAMPAEGAPDGIYVCNIKGTGGARIALYGVVPAVLAAEARGGVFAYLTAQANNYFKP